MRELVPVVALLALTAAAVYLVFLVGRAVVERRARRQAGEPEEVSLLVAAESEPTTLRGRIDRGFDDLVGETGLGITSAQALGMIALSAVIFAGIPLVVRPDFTLAALGLVLGVLLPVGYFMIQRARYRAQVQSQLPDAYFLMARSLRAGLNLEHALRTAADYGSQPLAGEFRRVVDQIELGLAPAPALQSMARRVRMPDFDILVTAVTLHRNVGGNLAVLLERVATSVRERNLFRGYFRAATALARITGFAIAAAPIVLLIGYAIFQPDFIERFTTSALGIRLLVVAAVLEVIGIIWLFALLRVDY